MNRLRKLFSIRAILYYLCIRFGSQSLRSWAYNRQTGKEGWNFLDKTHSSEVVRTVEKYANKGRILDMGCGPGTLVSLLNPSSFEYYQGVDVSSEAIALARKRASEKIHFERGSIQSYECKDSFDLIVFEESLYYVPFFRYRLLKRYATRLRPGGVFIVAIADPRRFARMIGMIRRKFRVIEDRYFQNSKRFLLVFSIGRE
jgi:SAM-dependent methyltransferase